MCCILREAELAKFHVCSRHVCVCWGHQVSWSTVNTPCTERRAECERLLLSFEVLCLPLWSGSKAFFSLSFQNSYKVLIQCPPHDVFLLVPQRPSPPARNPAGVPALSSLGSLPLLLALSGGLFWNPPGRCQPQPLVLALEGLCSLLFR